LKALSENQRRGGGRGVFAPAFDDFPQKGEYMDRKTVAAYLLDGAVALMAAISVTLIQQYISTPLYRLLATVACALPAILILGAEFWPILLRRLTPEDDTAVTGTEVRGLALLGEENNTVALWDLSGFTAALIGRGGENAQPEIDLSGTEYGGLIDRQHASLNFVEDNWYVEDLSSTNGTATRRAGDEAMALAPGVPCRIEAGDEIILAGRARLLVR
jgi:hypothetical protein